VAGDAWVKTKDVTSDVVVKAKDLIGKGEDKAADAGQQEGPAGGTPPTGPAGGPPPKVEPTPGPAGGTPPSAGSAGGTAPKVDKASDEVQPD
jgi:hypothetical protein